MSGEKAWNDYIDRNRSLIVDLFYGQLKSSLTCPECGTVSTTFDPFLTLSLPLVDEKSVTVKCVFVSYEERGEDKVAQFAKYYGMRLPGKDAKVGDLKARMADLVGADTSDLMIGLMHDIKIRVINRVLKDDENIASLYGTIFCYKVPNFTITEEKDNEEKRIDAVIVHYTCKLGTETFGVPIIRRYATKKISGAVFYKSVWDALGPTFEQGQRLFEEKKQLEPQKEVNTESTTENNECTEPSGKKIKQDDTLEKEKEKEKEIENNNVNKKTNEIDNDTKKDHKHTDAYPFILTYQSQEGSIESISLDEEVEVRSNNFSVCIDWCARCIEKVNRTPFSSITIHKTASDIANREQGGLTLDECMSLFLTREQLDQGDSWTCPHCKEPRQAFKKMDIWRLPKVLVVHLKRFHSSSRWAQGKISTDVKFDVDLWDVSKHICPQRRDAAPTKYRLFAVSNHYGTLNGGHYTAFARNKLDGKWYLFNDSKCTRVEEGDVKTNSAYMLFYERI